MYLEMKNNTQKLLLRRTEESAVPPLQKEFSRHVLSIPQERRAGENGWKPRAAQTGRGAVPPPGAVCSALWLPSCPAGGELLFRVGLTHGRAVPASPETGAGPPADRSACTVPVCCLLGSAQD